ncbi:MAG: AtpZ/AtpI family protein [Anaerolineae bacterium]|nr:AtpZ/AtpI family protein [Anaerolineae bacterium]
MYEILRSVSLATQVGVMVVASILACLFLGLWVDSRLGITPVATLVLIAVGTLVAIVGSYRLVSPVAEQEAAKQKAEIPTRAILRSLAFVTCSGLMVVAPVLMGLFLGLWLDGRLQTRPWVTLFLTVLGIVVGLVGIHRLSFLLARQLREEGKKGDS